MSGAYDPALAAQALALAAGAGLTLHEGVYAWFLGPQFETPAEIRMARLLGAQAVGMSTVPETILARHAGMKVLALSLLTNMAAGMAAETLSQAGQCLLRRAPPRVGHSDPITSNLYDALQAAARCPRKALLASLGCGNPTALAELKAGETVLDLGSGGGIDVLLSARRVGPTGVAYGLDMTDRCWPWRWKTSARAA
jgi:hypothetical protein